MKKLLTVGDSFTYGEELDLVTKAWPYRLADSLEYKLNNLGQSGASNANILRKTLEELAVDHYDLVVIGWTSPGRIEWKDDVGPAYSIWPGHQVSAGFLNDTPWRQELLNFINKHHCSEYLYQQYLIQVISLQSFCKARNINCVMLNINSKDYYHNVGREIHEELARQIDTEFFIGWENFGMMQIAHGCPIGPRGHPLDQGHKKIAEKINEHIRNFGWIS